MDETTIGLIVGFLAAAAAVYAAVLQRKGQQRAQEKQWLYDRRRQAYTAFGTAARAFVSVTEPVFLEHSRAEAAFTESALNGSEPDADEDGLVLEETITWAEYLAPVLDDFDGKWVSEKAPALLQEVIAAYDGVDLEGPPEIAKTAHRVVVSAHRLLGGQELFEREAAHEPAASARDLRRAEVQEYFNALFNFRRQSKVHLDTTGKGQKRRKRTRSVR